jgi:hypothetical protein
MTDGLASTDVRAVFAHGTDLYAATGNGLSVSSDGGSTWINKTAMDGLGSNALNDVFVTDSEVYAATSLGLSFANITPPCGEGVGQSMCLTMNIASTSGTNATVTLPLGGVMSGIYVDWGDGSPAFGPVSTGDPNPSHTYASANAYTIAIHGTQLQNFGNFDSTWTGADKLTGVTSWGDLGLDHLDSAFSGATSLTTVPTTLPNTITSLYDTFEGASQFNGDISGWDTQHVLDMSYLFYNATSFNRVLSSWYVGNVGGFTGIFAGASAFNESLSSWQLRQNGVTITLDGSGMSSTNYSATLIGWASETAGATGVTLTGGPKYSASASTARQSLLGRNWTITDGGMTVTINPPSVARSVVGTPGNSSVVVSWAAPASNGGAAITGYVVTASPKVGSVYKSCSTNGTTLACTVPGLTNGKSYTFRVTSTNAAAQSSTTAASAAVIAGTPTVARTLAVTFPAAKSAKLTWVAPKSTNSGAVTGYRVRWCKMTTCSTWTNLSPTKRSTTTANLTKNLTYRVEIQAKNGSGYGPMASKTFKQAK